MAKVLLKNGINIHYQRVGEGPDLVMVHGLTGNLAVWHLKLVGLLRDHFRILTYDLRGHGYSDVPATGYTAGDMAEDLGLLLDALEIEQPYVVGHSYGADTALYLALTQPESIKKVIAIEPGMAALIKLRKREDWEGWTYWSQVLERFGFPVPPERRTDIDYLLRLSLQVPKIFGPATGRPRKAEPLLRLLNETTMVQDYEEVGELTLDNVGAIRTPVVLIGGEGSAFKGTYDFLSANLPCVSARMLPASEFAHFGPLEQPEMLADFMLDALDPDETLVESEEGARVP
jgi:pimeloyl-ACP methyl ester carboxylesterase